MDKLASLLEGRSLALDIKAPGMKPIHMEKNEGPLANLLSEEHTAPLTDCVKEETPDYCLDLLESTFLCKLQILKFEIMNHYILYGDTLKTFYRDGIFDHFKEHIKEERSQLYQINKKITICIEHHRFYVDLFFPELDPKAMFNKILELETKSVKLWTCLFHSSKDTAINGMAQNYAIECQGHADDMQRYLKSSEFDICP